MRRPHNEPAPGATLVACVFAFICQGQRAPEQGC